MNMRKAAVNTDEALKKGFGVVSSNPKPNPNYIAQASEEEKLRIASIEAAKEMKNITPQDGAAATPKKEVAMRLGVQAGDHTRVVRLKLNGAHNHKTIHVKLR